MRDDDDARDGDDDDAVVEAEEAHARAVAKHLFSKLERHERVESTTTTTSAADESRSNAARETRENERALVSLMDKRARRDDADDRGRPVHPDHGPARRLAHENSPLTALTPVDAASVSHSSPPATATRPEASRTDKHIRTHPHAKHLPTTPARHVRDSENARERIQRVRAKHRCARRRRAANGSAAIASTSRGDGCID